MEKKIHLNIQKQVEKKLFSPNSKRYSKAIKPLTFYYFPRYLCKKLCKFHVICTCQITFFRENSTIIWIWNIWFLFKSCDLQLTKNVSNSSNRQKKVLTPTNYKNHSYSAKVPCNSNHDRDHREVQTYFSGFFLIYFGLYQFFFSFFNIINWSSNVIFYSINHFTLKNIGSNHLL